MTNTNTSKLKFTNARLLAIQALYAHSVSGEDWDKITSRFLLGEMGGKLISENDKGDEEYITIEEADAGLFTQIMKAAREHKEDIENTLHSALSGNVLYERLELTLQCILQAGIAEFYANPSLDTPIIINEYVDIARSFYDGSEIKITNAVLDKFAKIVRG